MPGYVSLGFVLVLVTSNPAQVPTTTSAPGALSVREPLEIGHEDLVLLAKTVRAALRDRLAGKPQAPARYRPPALRGKAAILHATLRRDGGVVAEAQTEAVDLVDGAEAAGTLLGQAVLSKKSRLSEAVDSCGLELEWLGPPEVVAAGNDEQGKWTDALLHCFEPGVEGIGVEFRGRRGWTRPSQVISLNYTPDVAIKAAEKAIELKQIDKTHAAGQTQYFRFRTLHVWHPDAASRPVVLIRGEIPILQEAVTAGGLDAAIARMGKYLRYRQNRDGWYSEEYLPSVDQYTKGNSAVVQMRAIGGLAAYAAWSGDREALDAAAKGISRSVSFLAPLYVPLGESASQPTTSRVDSSQIATTQAGEVLAFPGHEAYLELSGRMLAAMLDLPAGFEAERAALVEALLASQDEKGRMEMLFRPRADETLDDAAAAGVGLWALAKAGQRRTDPRIERAMQLGQRYYSGWFNQRPDPAGAVSVARALTLGYVLTNDARVSDFVFQVLDQLVALQLTADKCPWPELRGAFCVGEPGKVGIDTAIYLSGLADGLQLAERVGDKPRVEAYRRAVQMAARFVMQLEVREQGCYYVRNRMDALGGARTAPWNNTIRADHCAEAAISLIRARIVLFGPRV